MAEEEVEPYAPLSCIGQLGMRVPIPNLLTILVCSIGNFLAGDSLDLPGESLVAPRDGWR